MKILFFVSTLFLFSCSNNIEKQILENNKEVDFSIYETIVNDSTLYFFFPEEKFLDIKYIINKTNKWEPERFYISTENSIGAFLRGEDERSDNNTTYLFAKLNNLVSNNEKKALAIFSQAMSSKIIDYDFKKFKKISLNEKFEGMCIEISSPIYSSNNELAFLNVYLHKNLSKKTLDTTTYYEKIGVILKKDDKGDWKFFTKKLWLML